MDYTGVFIIVGAVVCIAVFVETLIALAFPPAQSGPNPMALPVQSSNYWAERLEFEGRTYLVIGNGCQGICVIEHTPKTEAQP